MDRAFDNALGLVLRLEGGYSNDAADAGGETRFGISKKSYPSVDIASLTVDDAAAIYFRDYWQANRCDEMPNRLGVFLFDSAIQHGPRTASRLLQRALNVGEDGIIGEATLAAARRAGADVEILRTVTIAALAYRAAYYAEIIRGNSEQKRFEKGWYRRLFVVAEVLFTLDN